MQNCIKVVFDVTPALLGESMIVLVNEAITLSDCEIGWQHGEIRPIDEF